MLSLFGMFARASTKLLATFVVVIIMMILAFAFFPQAIVWMQDFIELLDERLRNPPMQEQAKVLYRTLVNENTMFGIIMTIIARMVVELIAWAGGSVWKSMKGDSGATATASKHSY